MVCMCISVCLYMWAYICIHTVPVDLILYVCDLHDDTCNCTYTERERFSAMICVPIRTSGTVDSGHVQMQIGVHERILQPFFPHLMVTFPVLLLAAFTLDHGIWLAVKTGYSPRTKEKGLLSLLSLSVDLPAGCGSVQTECPDWMGWWRSISCGLR